MHSAHRVHVSSQGVVVASSLYQLPNYDTEDFYPLATFLRKLREPVYPTPAKAAEDIGVARTTAEGWEKDRSVPNEVRGYLAHLAKLNVDRHGRKYYQEYQGDLAQELLEQVNLAIVEDEKLYERKVERFKDWSELCEVANVFSAARVEHDENETLEQPEQALPIGLLAVPIQKRQPVPYFVGRETEIEQVLTNLHPGHIVTLVGHGGVGKSQIAAKVVERLAPGDLPPERFPDGIVFYSFYGENKGKVEIALEHIITRFGEKPGPALDETALDTLAGKQALLWLDGTEHADNLKRILDIRGTNCGVLITSQKRSDITEFWVDIDPLPFEDANALMLALGQDSASHMKARKRIYDLVGDVTLAIELAGAHLRDLDDAEAVETYIAWLEERCLEALHSGDHRRESVYILMKRSVYVVSKWLGEGARLVLALMGILASEPVDLAVLAAALGVEKYDVKLILEGLANYSILIWSGSRYTVRHNMIYEYIQRYLPPPDEALTRLAVYYAQLAQEESKRGLEGYMRLEPERAHIVAIVTNCAKRQRWIEVQQLVAAIDEYLDEMENTAERKVALEAGLSAAKALHDEYSAGAILNNLGNVYQSDYDWDRAAEYYQQSLQIFRRTGDAIELAGVCFNLGVISAFHGNWNEAIEFYNQGLDALKELKEDSLRARFWDKLAAAYMEEGDIDKGMECYEKAYRAYRRQGDISRMTRILGDFGFAYMLWNRDKAGRGDQNANQP